MLKAKKDNMQYTIEEKEVEVYIKRGFDILDADGKVLEHGERDISAKEAIKLKEAAARYQEKSQQLKAELTQAQERIEQLEAELSKALEKAEQPEANPKPKQAGEDNETAGKAKTTGK